MTIALPPSVYRLCNHYTSTSPFTHIIIGSLHNVCTAITCICALILPQDSRLDRSVAHSRATCIQLHVLSGCRAIGVTLVAWQRPMCIHHTSVRCLPIDSGLLAPLVHTIHRFLDLSPSRSLNRSLYIYLYSPIYIYIYMYKSMFCLKCSCASIVTQDTNITCLKYSCVSIVTQEANMYV